MKKTSSKPLSGREWPRFSGIKTFFRLSHSALDGEYDLGLVGVPFDGGTSYRPGARFAPTSVREMSSLARTYHWSRKLQLIDKIRVSDLGDAPTSPVSQEKTYEWIERFFEDLLKREKKFLAIGGDHSISLPLLRAVSKKHGPLSLIHFDAHLDTYPLAWGSEYHHGTFLRHAILEGLIEAQNSLHIGLRGPLVEDKDLNFAREHGLNLITVDEVRETHLNEFLSKKWPSFKKCPAYITFDVDCIDPSMAPGTGTPVVGGLTTYEIQRLLRALKVENLVAGDIVEICPPFDSSHLTSLVGVDILFEIMCLFASSSTEKSPKKSPF